jgi:hypothetical protein
MNAYEDMHQRCTAAGHRLAYCDRDYPLMVTEVNAGVVTYTCLQGEYFQKTQIEMNIYVGPDENMRFECPRQQKCK